VFIDNTHSRHAKFRILYMAYSELGCVYIYKEKVKSKKYRLMTLLIDKLINPHHTLKVYKRLMEKLWKN
jgi:hypothetical protein